MSLAYSQRLRLNCEKSLPRAHHLLTYLSRDVWIHHRSSNYKVLSVRVAAMAPASNAS
jgi:hypothetical protein